MVAADWLRAATSAARVAREEWGLGLDAPISDLLVVAEQVAGVPVCVLDLGPGLAGAYLVRRARPFIFVNGAESVVRQRFTLAHELGHFRFGDEAVIDGDDSLTASVKDPKEKAANAFAAELLAPEKGLRGWVAARNDPTVDGELIARLARWFGVSAPVAYYRLKNANLLPAGVAGRNLASMISGAQYRTIERTLEIGDFRDELLEIKTSGTLPRLPEAMRRNAVGAYRDGLIDVDRLAELLRRDREAVLELVSDQQPAEFGESDW